MIYIMQNTILSAAFVTHISYGLLNTHNTLVRQAPFCHPLSDQLFLTRSSATAGHEHMCALHVLLVPERMPLGSQPYHRCSSSLSSIGDELYLSSFRCLPIFYCMSHTYLRPVRIASECHFGVINNDSSWTTKLAVTLCSYGRRRHYGLRFRPGFRVITTWCFPTGVCRSVFRPTFLR